MKLTDVKHIKMCDVFKIYTDKGEYILTIDMSPQTDKEPLMSVTTTKSEKVSVETEADVIELFLSAKEKDTSSLELSTSEHE